MSGLAALLAGHTPPKVYQWHNAASVEDVRHAVEKAGWSFHSLDGWTIEDKETFLKATAAVPLLSLACSPRSGTGCRASAQSRPASGYAAGRGTKPPN